MQSLEPVVHGRGRKANSLEDTYFGVHQEQLYARKLKPVEGKLMLGHFCASFKMTKFCCFWLQCISFSCFSFI